MQARRRWFSFHLVLSKFRSQRYFYSIFLDTSYTCSLLNLILDFTSNKMVFILCYFILIQHSGISEHGYIYGPQRITLGFIMFWVFICGHLLG